MAVALNSIQITELQNFLQNAQYADGYKVIGTGVDFFLMN
jgi:hypothetical protein